MNISLPELLTAFVVEQVAKGGDGARSACVQELIRRDQERLALRALLSEGAASPAGPPADASCFSSLRKRASSPRARR